MAALLLALLLLPGVVGQSGLPVESPTDPTYVRPDLRVQRMEMTPRQPSAGEPFQMCATFGNDGGSEGQHTFAAALLFGGEEVAYDVYYELPSAGTALCTNLTAPAGEHVWQAVVDVHNDIEESRETNNDRGLVVRIPGAGESDLYVETFRVTPREPRAHDSVAVLTASIANAGGLPVRNVTVAILWNGEVLANQTLSSVHPGHPASVRHHVSLRDHRAGDHVAGIRIDPYDVLNETDKRNNEMSIPVRVPPAEGPDLAVLDVRWVREDGRILPPEDGDLLRLEATLANRGTQAASAANLTFSLRGEEAPLAARVTRELAPGEIIRISAPWIAEAGNWTLEAVVNPDPAAQEINLTNNRRVTSLDVEPPIPAPHAPDLAVDRVGHTPTPAVAGRGLNLTALLRNRGHGDSAPALVSFQVDGEEVARIPLGVLPTNGSVLLLAPWTAPSAGDYTVDALVLPEGQDEDANALNNAASFRLRAHPRGYSPQPDAADDGPAEAPPAEDAPSNDTASTPPDEPAPPAPSEPPIQLGHAEAADLRERPANGTEGGRTFLLAVTNPTDGLATAFRVVFHVDGKPHGAPVDVPGVAPGGSLTIPSAVWTGSPGEHTVEARIVPVDGSEWPRSTVRATFQVEESRGLPLAPGLALLAIGIAAAQRRRA